MDSVSSSNTMEDDNLFPESAATFMNTGTDFPRPQTPQNDHLNASAPGELSPPRSQSHSQAQTNPDLEPAFTFANGHANTNYRAGSSVNQAASGSGDAPKPGAWKNKRAQEEYIRAMENVIDKDFSLREFGDVMADSAFDMNVFGALMSTAQQRQNTGEKGGVGHGEK